MTMSPASRSPARPRPARSRRGTAPRAGISESEENTVNHQSDYGYSTGAVSMRCVACGSYELDCCDGGRVMLTVNEARSVIRDAAQELTAAFHARGYVKTSVEICISRKGDDCAS